MKTITLRNAVLNTAAGPGGEPLVLGLTQDEWASIGQHETAYRNATTSKPSTPRPTRTTTPAVTPQPVAPERLADMKAVMMTLSDAEVDQRVNQGGAVGEVAAEVVLGREAARRGRAPAPVASASVTAGGTTVRYSTSTVKTFDAADRAALTR